VDVEELDRVYEAFCDFHAFFAPAFGRKQWQDHSRHYLQALLVQSQERRNAENLSEMVPVSARAFQRFLTEAHWEDAAVIGRLQEYLGSRLAHPLAVWVFDGSDFPKQGVKSVGVARQYCGVLGKVASCQSGVFLAHVGPRGRALVDKRLYLPEGWTSDPARCVSAGVPEAQRGYRAKTHLALEMLREARARGYLSAQWATGDDAFGMSPEFRDSLTAEGMQYVLEVPPETPVWPLEPTWSSGAYQGRGRPRRPKLLPEERQTVAERSLGQPKGVWRQVTVAQGAQGPRTYWFSAQRVRETRNREPGGVLWAVYRQNLDGSEPRYYFSNGPEDIPLETLARVGGSRWPIETEFETEKSDVGLDEYETRTWAGWHHHITLCLLAGAFLLSLQQGWGEKAAPDHAPAGAPSGARDAASGAVRAH
jgi:SRSO17 transposase